MQLISAQKILTPEGLLSNQTLCIQNGIIQHIRAASEQEMQDSYPGTLIPGYVDVQVNGGGGILFNQAPTYNSLNTMASAHLQFGTTSMMPTLITDTCEVMMQAADAVSEAIAAGHPNIEGIHFEGPFLSTPKKGIHKAGYIRSPGDKELAILCRKDIGKVIVTVAPENVSTSLIKELVAEGVKVSVGHTNATFEQTYAALDAGATGFTHLYNAMSAFTSRAPGVVGAALLNNNACCGLIVDHQHVHPKSAELAIKTKTADKIMLVTDAMAHVGSDIARLDFFDTEICREGNKLTTPDGTLAGSCLDMHSALLNVCRDLQVSLSDASKMASTTPARFLGIEQTLGSIAEGKKANVLLINERYELEKVWLNGQLQS